MAIVVTRIIPVYNSTRPSKINSRNFGLRYIANSEFNICIDRDCKNVLTSIKRCDRFRRSLRDCVATFLEFLHRARLCALRQSIIFHLVMSDRDTINQ